MEGIDRPIYIDINEQEGHCSLKKLFSLTCFISQLRNAVKLMAHGGVVDKPEWFINELDNKN